MKVKLTVSLSGPNGAWNAGDEYDCNEGEAKSLIAAGYAVPIAAPVIERAVAEPATERRATRKKG